MDQRPGKRRGIDYRASSTGRRRSWYGLKKHAKRFLSLRIPHAILRRAVRVAPALARTGRLPAPAALKEVGGRVDEARFVMLRPDRCVVAKELYWGQGRRPRAQDDLALRVFARLARDVDVTLDIGAYTGIFTLVAAAINDRVEAHAFEIVPDVYRALFDNCVRNMVLHRTTLHHIGIGEPDSLMRLPSNASDSALPDFLSRRLHFDTGVPVRFRSLDWVAGLLGPGSRVLVKVDVEGTENEVFEHGQGFLASFKPDILCEVLAGVARPQELQSLLTPHGYSFYLVRGADLRPAGRIQPDARFRDWLFTTRGADDLAHRGIPLAP